MMLETKNLHFAFPNSNKLLQGINVQVVRGAIYGFLGANGSGKTTTIRLLLGLLPSPPNTISLFGCHLRQNRAEIFSRIGSLIEQPSLYEHLTGYDNLEISRRVRGVEKKRIGFVLELVDLERDAAKKVRDYSMGMKQRLGLAVALLSEPELLILDEPVNGLDPNGILEMRQLLLRLNKESGVTIFLSSHLLSEIEKIVTHVGILNKGALIFQGSYGELEELQQKGARILIQTNDNHKAYQLLQSLFPSASLSENVLLLPFQNKQQYANSCRILVNAGIDIYEMQVENRNLESIFLDITKS